MGYKLRFLPLANLDLVEIDESMSEAPVKAKRFFEALNRQTAAAKRMPRMYQEYSGFPPYRAMVVVDYIAFYLVDDASRTIIIHRVLWGGMDLVAALKSAQDQASQ